MSSQLIYVCDFKKNQWKVGDERSVDFFWSMGLNSGNDNCFCCVLNCYVASKQLLNLNFKLFKVTCMYC